MTAPTGLDSLTPNVWVNAISELSTAGTTIVLLVLPGANVMVPETAE
jgi:hypothetical protein